MQGKIYFVVLLFALGYGVWAQDTESGGRNEGNPGNPSGRGNPGNPGNPGGVGSGSSESDRDSSESNEKDSSEQHRGKHHPCPSLDQQCIRDYFYRTGQCTPVSHQEGQPIQVKSQVAYVSKYNITIECYDDIMKYNGVKFLGMYLDEETNTLVFTIKMEVTIDSPHTVWKFERVGKMDKVVNEAVKITYAVIVTAQIHWTHPVSLRFARVTAYVINGHPPMVIGPKISNSSDKHVRNTFQLMLSDLPTVTQELLRAKAYYFFVDYVQYFICDFGHEFSGEINSC